jgi:hypothetical protein
MSLFENLKYNIPEEEFEAVNKMWQRINEHRSRHVIRQTYYEGTNALKDFGISLPPSLAKAEVAMNWPQKAVDMLSQRVTLEGFTLPDEDDEDFGIQDIFFDNRLLEVAPQVTHSSVLHGVSFLAVFRGDESKGEPKALIQPFSALEASGLWQPNTRSLGAALLILNEKEGNPTRAVIFFPHVMYVVEQVGKSDVVFTAQENTLGYVPVFSNALNPSLQRPFGKSYLSRAMMSYTDSAMRTVIRSEIAAEFHASPQKYVIGASEEAFTYEDGSTVNPWSVTLGRLLVLPHNTDDDVTPQIGQFEGMSMTPHIDQFRMFAGLFSSATGVPASSLGVLTENQQSSEATMAAREDLLVSARDATRSFTNPWVQTMITAVMIYNDLTEVPEALKELHVRWADPATPSRAAMSDATLKLVQAGVIPADSDVALEMVGLSKADILRVKAHRQRAQAPNRLSEVLGSGNDETALQEAQILKQKADALSSLRRSGVTAEDASKAAGLEGLSFLPGAPVTIRAEE